MASRKMMKRILARGDKANSSPPKEDWPLAPTDPCTCSPGDGSETCPREDECYENYLSQGERDEAWWHARIAEHFEEHG